MVQVIVLSSDDHFERHCEF